MSEASDRKFTQRQAAIMGAISGAVGGLATSLVLFEFVLQGQLKWLGILLLVILRGSVLGAAGGGVSALLLWSNACPRAPWLLLALGLLIGSLFIFLPIPFTMPPELLDAMVDR